MADQKSQEQQELDEALKLLKDVKTAQENVDETKALLDVRAKKLEEAKRAFADVSRRLAGPKTRDRSREPKTHTVRPQVHGSRETPAARPRSAKGEAA